MTFHLLLEMCLVKQIFIQCLFKEKLHAQMLENVRVPRQQVWVCESSTSQTCNPEELSIKVIWLILQRVYQVQLLSVECLAAGKSNGKQEWQRGPGEAVPELSTRKMSAHKPHHISSSAGLWASVWFWVWPLGSSFRAIIYQPGHSRQQIGESICRDWLT